MIYHIAEQTIWLAQQDADTYQPTEFKQEGFIHCSDLQQVERTANNYYQGRDDLVLLEIDPTQLIPETRYENLLGGTEKFPHVYGEINKSAVQQVIALRWSEEGGLVFSNPPLAVVSS